MAYPGRHAVVAGGALTQTVEIGRPLRRNRTLQVLCGAYLAVWGVAALAPHDRSDWLLENLVVFAFVGLLAATHRRYAFSNLSYLLFALFMCLHALGAHYTYSLTPVGFWIQETLGLERNPYDRIVHFAFGLLLVYPLRELARRVLHVRASWSSTVALLSLVALSSGYEIVESWTARIVDPELGTAFLGTQGDEWDAQKDMALALAGALAGLAASELYRAHTGREPWRLLS
jgi:putative membrane protein